MQDHMSWLTGLSRLSCATGLPITILQENPYATYLFIEAERGYKGLRLFLKKDREDQDLELINQMTRRCLTPEEDEAKGPKFLVYFKIEKALKLIGSDSPQITLP